VPTRGDILRAAGRGDEDAVDAERLTVSRGLDLLVGGDRPGAGDDRHPALHLLHRDFEHAPLLLPRQVEDLAGLRIDAKAAAGPNELFVLKEILEEAAIRPLVDLHVLVEG